MVLQVAQEAQHPRLLQAVQEAQHQRLLLGRPGELKIKVKEEQASHVVEAGTRKMGRDGPHF